MSINEAKGIVISRLQWQSSPSDPYTQSDAQLIIAPSIVQSKLNIFHLFSVKSYTVFVAWYIESIQIKAYSTPLYLLMTTSFKLHFGCELFVVF